MSLQNLAEAAVDPSLNVDDKMETSEECSSVKSNAIQFSKDLAKIIARCTQITPDLVYDFILDYVAPSEIRFSANPLFIEKCDRYKQKHQYPVYEFVHEDYEHDKIHLEKFNFTTIGQPLFEVTEKEFGERFTLWNEASPDTGGYFHCITVQDIRKRKTGSWKALADSERDYINGYRPEELREKYQSFKALRANSYDEESNKRIKIEEVQ